MSLVAYTINVPYDCNEPNTDDTGKIKIKKDQS